MTESKIDISALYRYAETIIEAKWKLDTAINDSDKKMIFLTAAAQYSDCDNVCITAYRHYFMSLSPKGQFYLARKHSADRFFLSGENALITAAHFDTVQEAAAIMKRAMVEAVKHTVGDDKKEQ